MNKSTRRRSNFDTNYSTIFRRPNFAPASACWILSDKKRKRGMEMKNKPPFDEFEVERTAKTKMGARLESGNGAATELQEPRRVKTSRVSKQRIPNWGYFLFVLRRRSRSREHCSAECRLRKQRNRRSDR